MAGTLAAKARRLELARGISRDGSKVSPAVGLVWSGAGVVVDPGALADGELLITDYVVERYSPPDPAQARTVDRVTRDASDYGRVLAYDGREIGRVLRSSRGGIVLEFAWPEGPLPPVKARQRLRDET
jgi:hypothetical protein